MPHVQRRRLLLGGGALLAGAAGASLFTARNARAADYKALVCVFLYGGNDAMNMVVPTDSTRYNQYAGVRGALALPRTSLAALPGSDYGLHPAMSALLPAWNASQLAPVFNVGPLAQPITKTDYVGAPPGSPIIPENLFSHSDQQLLWACGGRSAVARTGWGGRGSATLGTVNPVISVGGNGLFGVEALRSPLVLPSAGSFFGAYGFGPDDLQWEPNRLRKEALDALFANPQPVQLGDAYRDQQQTAFEISGRLGDIVASLPGDGKTPAAIDSAFAPLLVDGQLPTDIAAQLFQVAKLVAANAQVQGSRQMFFAQAGGFDTHDGQVDGGDATKGYHALLLGQLADAMAAFQRAMDNLGMGTQVTLFTHSDFGRTFAPNLSYGSDHAWGTHQLVLGGAVKGRATYGSYPTLVLGGPDDVGVEEWELQGRWIPTSSVDQFAATLMSWFGASASQLDTILPNLVNFGSARSLGFV